jgi:hypothetical protein
MLDLSQKKFGEHSPDSLIILARVLIMVPLAPG